MYFFIVSIIVILLVSALMVYYKKQPSKRIGVILPILLPIPIIILVSILVILVLYKLLRLRRNKIQGIKDEAFTDSMWRLKQRAINEDDQLVQSNALYAHCNRACLCLGLQESESQFLSTCALCLLNAFHLDICFLSTFGILLPRQYLQYH